MNTTITGSSINDCPICLLEIKTGTLSRDDLASKGVKIFAGKNVVKLDCHHIYHEKCAKQMLEHQTYKCSLCRKSIKLTDIQSLKVNLNVIEKKSASLPSLEQEQRPFIYTNSSGTTFFNPWSLPRVEAEIV